jgi:hypothetical protein
MDQHSPSQNDVGYFDFSMKRGNHVKGLYLSNQITLQQ